jgi:hypothetical protein
MRSVADGGCRSHRVKVACNPFTCIQSIDNKLALYSHQKPSWLQCICFLRFNNHLSLTLLTPGTSPQDALENDLCLCLCLSLSLCDRALLHLSPLLAGVKHRHYCLIHLSLSLSLRKKKTIRFKLEHSKTKNMDSSRHGGGKEIKHTETRTRARAHTHTTEREK